VQNSYIHVRGVAEAAVTGGADSVHIGLDGTIITGAGGVTRLGRSGSHEWGRTETRTGTIVTLQVTEPGLHSISLYPREDGVTVDKLLDESLQNQQGDDTIYGGDGGFRPDERSIENLLAFFAAVNPVAASAGPQDFDSEPGAFLDQAAWLDAVLAYDPINFDEAEAIEIFIGAELGPPATNVEAIYGETVRTQFYAAWVVLITSTVVQVMTTSLVAS